MYLVRRRNTAVVEHIILIVCILKARNDESNIKVPVDGRVILFE